MASITARQKRQMLCSNWSRIKVEFADVRGFMASTSVHDCKSTRVRVNGDVDLCSRRMFALCNHAALAPKSALWLYFSFRVGNSCWIQRPRKRKKALERWHVVTLADGCDVVSRKWRQCCGVVASRAGHPKADRRSRVGSVGHPGVSSGGSTSAARRCQRSSISSIAFGAFDRARTLVIVSTVVIDQKSGSSL